MNTDAIKQLLQDFSFETFLEDLLPELAPLLEKTALLSRLLMLIGPFIILGMGLYYFLNAPKEANFRSGYRCYFGMGSVEAWRFSQRLAGAVLGGLGLILTGVMLVISMGFPGMEAMDMVWKAFWCLIWQGGLALLANAGIWLAAFLRYDARGNLRKKQK